MANKDRLFIGNDKNTNEPIYLYKHSWDCGWYWGMGYLGNSNCHFHFDSYLKDGKYDVSDHLSQSPFTQADWWILRDLFVQAYALKAAAEVYCHGGHQTHKAFELWDLRNPAKAEDLNKDLENILEAIWGFVSAVHKRITLTEEEQNINSI